MHAAVTNNPIHPNPPPTLKENMSTGGEKNGQQRKPVFTVGALKSRFEAPPSPTLVSSMPKNATGEEEDAGGGGGVSGDSRRSPHTPNSKPSSPNLSSPATTPNTYSSSPSSIRRRARLSLRVTESMGVFEGTAPLTPTSGTTATAATDTTTTTTTTSAAAATAAAANRNRGIKSPGSTLRTSLRKSQTATTTVVSPRSSPRTSLRRNGGVTPLAPKPAPPPKPKLLSSSSAKLGKQVAVKPAKPNKPAGLVTLPKPVLAPKPKKLGQIPLPRSLSTKRSSATAAHPATVASASGANGKAKAATAVHEDAVEEKGKEGKEEARLRAGIESERREKQRAQAAAAAEAAEEEEARLRAVAEAETKRKAAEEEEARLRAVAEAEAAAAAVAQEEEPRLKAEVEVAAAAIEAMATAEAQVEAEAQAQAQAEAFADAPAAADEQGAPADTYAQIEMVGESLSGDEYVELSEAESKPEPGPGAGSGSEFETERVAMTDPSSECMPDTLSTAAAAAAAAAAAESGTGTEEVVEEAEEEEEELFEGEDGRPYVRVGSDAFAILYEAMAIFDFVPEKADELELERDCPVLVIEDTDESWWFGSRQGKTGYFPPTYIGPAQVDVAKAATTTKPEEDTEAAGKMAPVVPESSDPRPKAAPRTPPTVVVVEQHSATAATAATTTTTEADIATSTNADGEVIYGNAAAIRRHKSMRPPLRPRSGKPASRPQSVRITPETAAAVLDAGRIDAPAIGAAGTGGSDRSDTLGLASAASIANVVGAAERAAAAAAEQFDEDEPLFARAKFDFAADSDSQLALRTGTIVEIFSCEETEAWWSGTAGGAEGWFPATYVELLEELSEEDAAAFEANKAGAAERERRANKRKRIVEEIIETEETYLANLEHVILGYLRQMQRRVGELFDEESIGLIFSNIEQIQNTNREFLEALKGAGAATGRCFMEFSESFKVYSIYCNNHPKAVVELARISENDIQLQSFFEGCRMLAGSNLSLQNFLLEPVQRVCRYPLLLRELVKYTDPGDFDYESAVAAQTRMDKIASIINEDKRLKEEIMRLQASLEGWRGPDITTTCTMLIFEGPLMKISGKHEQERQFYLFDNLLVYCKRTLKGSLQVKGQIFTDSITVLDMNDGEVKRGRSPINNAFKINNVEKDKWYVLYAASKREKDLWIDAFLRERRKVQEDREAGMLLISSVPTTSFSSKKVRGVSQARSAIVKKHFDRKTLAKRGGARRPTTKR